jgi:hypothetical protein
MRALFLLLVLANVALYGWWRYGAPTGAADPTPLARQIEPERLRVISASELRPALAQKAPVCHEWGGFTPADAARAEQALEPLALGSRLAQRRSDGIAAAWWVFIPPQASRPAAFKKAIELKELGVDDYFVVQDEGEHRWAVSLGIFRTEEAAQARLAALRDKGVRTAQVGQRDAVVPRVWLQVKGVDAALLGKLKAIARQFEGTEVKECL